jgi:DnaJ homolog subfamily C member 28
MGLEQLIESQIQDAMAAGAFDNLPGAGKPLPTNDLEKLAGENWLGYKVLQSGGLLPDWLGLAREIELDHEALAALDARHADLVLAAAATAERQRFASGLDYLVAKYEQRARELRKKQDRFNMNAPGVRSERAGIWVEFHLERLRDRERAAGVR